MLTENSLRLIRMTSTIMGSTIGSLLSEGQDPIAKLAGTTLGDLIPVVLNDFAERIMSEREKIKTGAISLFLINKIEENLQSNRNINLNLLEEIDETHRNCAQILYEGILIKSKNEYEEKKLKYIANIFANALFQIDLNYEDINQILTISDEFTYRKLCIISLYAQKDTLFNNISLMNDPCLYYPEVEFPFSMVSTLQDIFELSKNGLIDLKMGAFDWSHFIPNKCKISRLGEKYFNLLNLNEIPQIDLDPIISNLSYREEFGINSQGRINGLD